MNVDKLTSAVYNNIVSGTPGLSVNERVTLEQIQDAIINERLLIIKEYMRNNIIPKKDLMLSIRCIDVDCENVSQCCGLDFGVNTQHMQVPQIFNDYGKDSVGFLGSTDNTQSFVVYTDGSFRNHSSRRRGKDKPYAWIDTTPNSEGLYDVFIFNAPLLKKATFTAIFKDPRQLYKYSCCNPDEYDNKSFIDTQVEKRVTENYLRYYRQFAVAMTPNNQQPK
jgi:hypothetical protein